MVALATRLANERRAMQGNALFNHKAGYDALSDDLVPLMPQELKCQCEAFRRDQMNSVQCRALAARVA